MIAIDKSQSQIRPNDRMFKLNEETMKFPFLCRSVFFLSVFFFIWKFFVFILRWFIRTNEIEKLHQQAQSLVSDIITITSITTGLFRKKKKNQTKTKQKPNKNKQK
jgi:hypothetical protein